MEAAKGCGARMEAMRATYTNTPATMKHSRLGSLDTGSADIDKGHRSHAGMGAPLTFMDEADADRVREPDPVAAAQRSKAAIDKVTSRRLPDGTPGMSFTRLLGHMATIVRNTVRSASARIGEATFTLAVRSNPKQQHALDLLATITV